jgi:thioredoxin:protein disulfide reductase
MDSTVESSVQPTRRCADGHHRYRPFRTATTLAWPLFILLASLFVNAQDTAYPPAANVIQPQAYASLQPVPRGTAFEIAVVAKISPGFHVNAHMPSEDYLIPTKIEGNLPSGLRLVETTYPRGVMRTFRFSKTPLRVYEGSFTVRMKLRANESVALGPQKIALTLGYQACNQDACLPPVKVPVTADLEFAAVDTPAHPAHSEIFSSTPAGKASTQR